MPKAVLITAGTKRLGFHFARTSLEMGYHVILHYRSTELPARQWLNRNPEFKNRVFFLGQELTVNPEHLIDRSLELPCALTGLVNNASIFTPGDIADIRHFQQMLDIHLLVPARLGAHFHSHVREGWIINITDALIDRPNLTYQNYRISKLFLRELTRQQALLFAPGCRVNAIAPGAMLPATHMKKEEFEALSRKTPLRSTGALAFLSDAFRYLVKNRYCTGETITVDGGRHLTA